MTWMFDGPHLDEVAVIERADAVLRSRPTGYLSSPELREATMVHGVDLATAMAYRAFLSDGRNAEFLARFERLPVSAAQARTGAPRIAIVPSMYYRERLELGGDGQLIASIARRFGAQVDIIPVGSLAGIEANADIIASFLRQWNEPGWIVTLSKGSADLKRALIRQPLLAEHLRGWVNVGGMPGGTPLADPRPGRPIAHALLQGWLLLRGADASMLGEMGREHAFSRDALALPDRFEVINLVPMPLSFHLRKPVDKSARYLATFGPNDGYVLLEDAVVPGRVVPIWGADHYLRTPALCDTLYRAVRHMLLDDP
ncbi:MAG: hypothetical protein H0V44_09645 [Planctomycetes bacterium]|nr:hypothetical protein [Planctomycetota bacterium]